MYCSRQPKFISNIAILIAQGILHACLPGIQLMNEILVQPIQFQFRWDYFRTSYLANNKPGLQARQPALHIVESPHLVHQPSTPV
jgi:hypothetical protein